MKKILYICPYLSMGGTEKHLLDLISGLDHKDELFLLAPPGETLPLFQQKKVTYYPFARLDQNLRLGLKQFSTNLKLIINNNHIDFIHIHGAAELMFLVRKMARRAQKVPIFFTVHGFHGELKGWDYWLCARLCNTYASQVITVAKAEERILIQKGLRRNLVTTILNGVPDPLTVDYEAPEEILALHNKIVIGAIARLETTKGIHFLLEAFQKIYQQYQNAHLVIVGTGSKEAELKALAAKLNIAEQVTFTGYRSNVHSYLHFFQIFIIPSLHEAHPLVLMEGMGHGKPIIATTVGGIPEVIEDGESGVLIPPGDASSIEKAIDRLLKEPAILKKFGDNARRMYEKEYTVDRMIQETEKIYDKLI